MYQYSYNQISKINTFDVPMRILVSWPSPLYAREKGSGNIVYNELSQTLECGVTNQIASFVIKTLFAYYKREFYLFEVAIAQR